MLKEIKSQLILDGHIKWEHMGSKIKSYILKTQKPDNMQNITKKRKCHCSKWVPELIFLSYTYHTQLICCVWYDTPRAQKECKSVTITHLITHSFKIPTMVG